jgi:hypothetical protein
MRGTSLASLTRRVLPRRSGRAQPHPRRRSQRPRHGPPLRCEARPAGCASDGGCDHLHDRDHVSCLGRPRCVGRPIASSSAIDSLSARSWARSSLAFFKAFDGRCLTQPPRTPGLDLVGVPGQVRLNAPHPPSCRSIGSVDHRLGHVHEGPLWEIAAAREAAPSRRSASPGLAVQRMDCRNPIQAHTVKESAISNRTSLLTGP